MRKATVWQRNMSAMQVRSDLLEADGTDLRARSLRTARNMRALSTGVIEARPGTLDLHVGTLARQIVEINPADGLTLALELHDNVLRLYDRDGVLVHSVGNVPWNDAERLWVVPLRERVIIGDTLTGLHVLEYSAGAWAFGDFAFAEGPGGTILQPYWNFWPGKRIRASAGTGTVTLTSLAPVFSAQHVGQRLRYGGREVQITAFNSSTSVTGNVIGRLPPSFLLTVGATSNFRMDEVIVGQESNYQGVISEIVSATEIKVATLDGFDGPFTDGDGERISGPSASTTVSAKTPIAPEYLRVWDEPLMSPLRKWPRSGAAVAGRLVLTDFPGVANAVALSSAGSVDAFDVGVEDDDAIVRTVGDDGARIRHAINGGDLLLLSERGIYVVNIRDQGLLTPANFAPVRVDNRGANHVRPVRADDAVVFVDAGGENVAIAMLDGSAQLRWSVRLLATFHHEVIRAPKSLCGPALSSIGAEKYVAVVNADGTLAVISWVDGLGEEGIGFAHWTTRGGFDFVAPVFGAYWTIVDRPFGTLTIRRVERFQDGIYVDSARVGNPASALVPHLAGETVAVVWRNRDAGAAVPNLDGSVSGFEFITGSAQVGLNFEAVAEPWPVEVIESPRVGTLTARIVRFLVSVQESGPFSILCNRDEREVNGYAFGDILANASPRRTDVFRAPIMGRRTHPYLAVVKRRPGPLRILALGQEVQA